ncbi:M56 family metallopeptidase [Nocardia sp. NPDC051030]|uniref:M56 family metallopeptidase n=1 Tax=Nocardia sp. NPDC051030 TaxID=3155162 RepID=UPI00341299BD
MRPPRWVVGCGGHLGTPGRDHDSGSVHFFRAGDAVSAAACLALYGFAVAVLAPRLLRGVGDASAVPRVALAAWLATLATTVLAWTTALTILVFDVLTHQLSEAPRRILDGCITHMHDAAIGRYGAPVQTGLLLLAGSASLAAVVVTMRLGATLLRARRTTLEHAALTRMAGRHHPDLDAVVLEVDQPAAYCVAGKPHTVVISRGVLTALDEDHLEAVLAHERAHLAGRHHLLLALTRGLSTTLPRINLFSIGALEVAWLLEMMADDAAARIHGRRTVLQALRALSGIASGPAGALGATEVGLTTRLQRLEAPAARALRARTRLTLAAVTAMATLVPMAAVLTAAIGIVICAPIPGGSHI